METVLPFPVTLDIYNSLPYSDIKRAEVIEGRIEPIPAHFMLDGIMAGQIMFKLGEWDKGRNDFESLGRCGYVLCIDPLTIQAPSVSVVNTSEIPRNRGLDRYWMGPPVVAVEMVPDGERSEALPARVERYLSAGTRLVLAVRSYHTIIEAYQLSGTVRIVQTGDLLNLSDVLPGFSVPMDILFKRAGR